LDGLSNLFVSTLFPGGMYIAVAVVTVWGWVRWSKRVQPRTVASILSLIGFALATASAILGISTLLYARAVHSFPINDPLLLRIFGCGALLSLSSTVFAILGIWRPGPLRWHALACGIVNLLLWFALAMAE